MGRKGRKPEIPPEIYRRWLQRFQDGESPPRIAKAEGYDVRTVRKYITSLQQEQELKEARSQVLRTALERHYADLVSFAAGVGDTVRGVSVRGSLERSNRLWEALKAHMPRSPLWKALERWERLKERERQLLEAGQGRMEQRAQGLAGLELSPVSTGKEGLYRPGLVALVVQRMKEAAAGRSSATWVITPRPDPGGLVTILCNELVCAMVSLEREQELTAFFGNLTSEIPSWPEVEDLRRTLGELERITMVAGEELAVIALRRVVPGRCKYCPF